MKYFFRLLSLCLLFSLTVAVVKPVIIVLDPGHGGKDPGAVSRSGVKEEAVVLATAKQVQAMLNQLPGFKVFLTRTKDQYVSLRGRIALARKDHANLLVSIHADSLPKAVVSGASAYVLSQKGQRREQTLWLERQDNRVPFVTGQDLDRYSRVRGRNLFHHIQKATIQSSLLLADNILAALNEVTRLVYPHPKRAAFMVLRAPDIPSVLVELGFLSNPEEAKQLATPAYQRQLSIALVKGILKDLKQNPPPNSYVSQYGIPTSLYYTVHKGDTLSAIARKFNFASWRSLMKATDLKSTRIYPGQKIAIPLSAF